MPNRLGKAYTKKRTRTAIATESILESVTDAATGLIRLDSVQPRDRNKVQKVLGNGVFFIAGGSTFVQRPGQPIQPGRVGLGLLSRPRLRLETPQAQQLQAVQMEDVYDAYQGEYGDLEGGINYDRVEEAARSQTTELKLVRRQRYHQCRRSQWKTWQQSVIPSLVPLFLEYQRQTRCGATHAEEANADSCNCVAGHRLRVCAVSLGGQCIFNSH
jgi:hypothetical protein